MQIESTEKGGTISPTGKWMLAVAILGVLLLAVIIWFAVYRAQASSAISKRDSDISSLRNQVTTVQSQLQGQLDSANSQITSLKSQAASLQNQITDLKSILSLSKSDTKVSAMTLNQGPTQSTVVVTFAAEYAGYVEISGTTTTGNAYIRVTDSFNGYPFSSYNYAFGNRNTLLVPVLPGTVNVNVGNHNDSEGATATLTVIYHY